MAEIAGITGKAAAAPQAAGITPEVKAVAQAAATQEQALGKAQDAHSGLEKIKNIIEQMKLEEQQAGKAKETAAPAGEKPAVPTQAATAAKPTGAGGAAPGADPAVPVEGQAAAAVAGEALQTDSPESSWRVEGNTIYLDEGRVIKLDESGSSMELTEANGDRMRIWGDPHIDVGDTTNQNEAEFKDQTTFKLSDGTKITVGTRLKPGSDMTYADTLTITKGEQGIEVKGLMQGEDALQVGPVTRNGQAMDARVDDGFIVEEGVESNTWVLEDGRTISENNAETVKFAGMGGEPEPAVAAADANPARAERKGQPFENGVPDDIAEFINEKDVDWDKNGDNAWSWEEFDGLMALMLAEQNKMEEEGEEAVDGLGDENQELEANLERAAG